MSVMLLIDGMWLSTRQMSDAGEIVLAGRGDDFV